MQSIQRVVFPVAIRFRWIWVEKLDLCEVPTQDRESQSAFAGYGLKSGRTQGGWGGASVSQSAFAGYGLKSERNTLHSPFKVGRNPLSLDMG